MPSCAGAGLHLVGKMPPRRAHVTSPKHGPAAANHQPSFEPAHSNPELPRKLEDRLLPMTTPATDLAETIEENSILTPQFNADGLIPAIATDAANGVVLMLAWMNAEALERTIETGQAWYWSRSRQCLWHKGATSGQVQQVEELRVDCDQDAVWLKVRVGGDGGCCHTGRASCFYRRIVTGPDRPTLRRVPEAPPPSR
jgi:phosphoribosyl-AMP cyclohydrolase